MEDLIATSLGEYFYNPVSEYFKTRPHEEWSDEGCVSWVLESTTRHKIISEFYKALEVMKEHRRTPTEPRSIAKKLLKRKKANRDDEPEATSSDRKKRDRDGDTLCHSTIVSAEEALSFVPPHIKFSPGAPASKSTTSAVGKPPKEVRLWESFFEEVNGHTFDQVKNLQAPKFAYEYPFSKERWLLTSFSSASEMDQFFFEIFYCFRNSSLDFALTNFFTDRKNAGSIWKTNINELQSSAFRFLEDAVNTYIKPLEKETEKENFLVSHRDLINKKGAEYEKNYTRSLENPTLPKMSEIGLLLSLSCVYAGGKVVQEIRKECNCEFFENLRDFTEDIGLNGLTGGLFNLGTQIAGHLAAREIARHGRKMINDAKVLIRVDQTIKVGSKVYATYEDTKEKIGYIVSTCHGHHKARGEVMTAIAQSIKDFVKISLL
ncbi:hypothetical protein C2G38_2044168 [Gigaspora rosea]|uniref:Uncharacterized protein n=1 Tax=Gigaspora rosea TaxID=44941 RepID=A0A397UKH0_9GLOM|nr:hypothetical protein C2G38_2044168 [Gigaspora rosea]